MDLAERMALVEGRLERVERALGLPPAGRPARSEVPNLPIAATPRTEPRVEAARDLLEDPAATASPPPATVAPSGLTPKDLAPGGVAFAPAAPDLLAPAGSVGAPLPPLSRATPPMGLRPSHPVPAIPSAIPSARPVPRAPRPAARRKPAVPAPGARGDMERFVGVAILGRVGIGAVLLAAGYFAQLAYAAFPPALRVASIYALAGLLIGVGALVRSRVAPRYVGILWGGGIAAAYMAGVVARLRYDLFPEGVALFALVASCALGQVLAKTLRQKTLALVALAGAIAAPVLVGGPTDSRVALLVYLLTLHAWAWFIERRYGATGARVLAVFGVAVVAVLWFASHGRGDASTWIHLHLYLFGLTFPEWTSVLRGRGLPERVARFQAIAAGAVELLLLGVLAMMRIGSRPDPSLVHRFLLVAGLAWAIPPIVGRLRARAAQPGSAPLALLAGACIAVGLFLWAGDPMWPGRVGFQVALGASAVFAALSVWARPRLGAGEVAAALASGLSLLLLTSIDPRDPLRLLAFVGPLALLFRGVRPATRIAGLAIGVAAAFGGILRDPSPWRPTVCLAMAAGFAVLSSLRARRIRDDALASLADLVLVALVAYGAWAAIETSRTSELTQSIRVAFRSVSPALLNPGTVAAAALVGALVLRLRTGPGTAAMASGVEPILRATLGALLLAAGWREVHAALRHVEALDLRAALGTLYLASSAAIFFAVAARRRDDLLAFEGLATLLLAVGSAFAHRSNLGPAWVSGVELAGLVASAGAGAWFLRSTSAAARTWLALLAVGIAGAWIAYVAGGRLGSELPLLNPRTLVAALGVALLVVLRSRTAEPALRPVRMALGLAAAGLAFGAGLVEVLDAVKDLPSGPIRSVLVSVYVMGFSAVLLFVGFRRRSLEVRWLALAGFAFTIGKVGLHDLASVSTPWRILVTGCLGVVLLGSAYAYARRDRGAAPSPGDEDPAPLEDDGEPPPPVGP